MIRNPVMVSDEPLHGLSAPSDGLARRTLLGLEMIDQDDLRPVLEAVLQVTANYNGTVVPMLVTPNVDIVVGLERAPDSIEAEVFGRAQYVLPDGMPIVAASRLLRAPLRSRLTGSGLFELLWPRLASDRRTATVVCANDEIATRLGFEHPEASFVIPAIFDASISEEVEAVVEQILDQVDFDRTEFVLLGLGHPKDAILAQRLWQQKPDDAPTGPLFLGLGGSFTMYTGLKRRAPSLVQRLGLEWFYRFCQEPRRLFIRYFVRDLAFFAIVAREFRTTMASRR